MLLLSGVPVWAQPMTMPDGSTMDMKDMPAKKPTAKLPKAKLPEAKPIAKPRENKASAKHGMQMPKAKSSAPTKGMTMPMDHGASHAPAPSQPMQNMPKEGMSQQGMENMPMDHGAAAPKEQMPGMDHMNMDHAAPSQNMAGMEGMNMKGDGMHGALGGYAMNRDSSGTSWQPDLGPPMGRMDMVDQWMLMSRAELIGIYDYQSGPRGGEMVFPSGMLMGMAQRDVDGGTVGFRAMLSPDPLMGRRGYPLLLASGETADGVTHLVDRQHPHDLVIELAGTYSRKLDDRSSIFLYLGYPGEPALGPPAFMHRASAMDDPAAPITHHWLDSTHVTFGVATAGVVLGDWKLEMSQFTGREPDQHRFDFDHARMDSTAARVSFNPDAHWSLQASWGHLNSPEQLEPSTDEDRTTASATYVTDVGEEGSLAATLAWGLKSLSDGTRLNGLLAEAEYKPAELWTLFARAEWEENAELVAGRTAHVGEMSLGGIRDFALDDHWKFGLGGLYAFDFPPSRGGYGNGPHGAMAFVRLVAE
jgi:hypothetical protein